LVSEAGWSDLRTFIQALRRENDVVEVAAPVDPCLEIAEVHRRVIAAGGPALLFTNVRGAAFPLVTNLFGTPRRAALAFGTRPQRLIKRLVTVAETLLPPSPAKLWAARDLVGELWRVGLTRTRTGAVTEVVTDAVRLDRLPALTCWPEDGGPFITLPLVYTEHPERPGHNLGMYRLQVYDPNTTGMHWQIGKGGGFHYAAAEARHASLPVTVFLGGPPALMLAAIAPLPENVPELLLASLLAGQRLRLVTGLGPHPLVAAAEFALMGHVPPGLRHPEGPFGDHYGYYSLTHDYPVFRVARMARRRDAIFPATVVGKPRQEDFFVGDLLQDLLSPLFPLVMPGVRDLWSYGETGYHSLAAAVVRERYGREALGSAFRILGEGQLALTKFLLMTDQPIDLKNFKATLMHLLARTRPETDLYVFGHTSMDSLDYAGPRVNEGSKGVWLGVGDPIRTLPAVFSGDPLPHGVADVRVFCPGCLVVAGPRFQDEPDAARRLVAHPVFRDWMLVVLSDDARRAVRSTMNFLWTTFTRFDPARDLHGSPAPVAGGRQDAWAPPVWIDARMKPWYPKELTAHPDTAKLVTRRWKEYFPSAHVEMGDSERAHLDA
jgi:UbiD family decarboxylase